MLASAHRIERVGETSREEPGSLPRNETMRLCRGLLRAAKVDGADAGSGRPRGSSSAITDGVGDFGRGEEDVDGADGAASAAADAEVSNVMGWGMRECKRGRR